MSDRDLATELARAKAVIDYLIDRLYGHVLSADEVMYLRKMMEGKK